MERKIKWKDGARFKCSAGAAFQFFESIRKENDGAIDFEAAEKKARSKRSPVHNDLEWDDAKCGVKYRIDQLQRMTRKLEVVRTDMKAPHRAYESVRVEVMSNHKVDQSLTKEQARQARVWRTTEEILADPAGRADLLNKAVSDAIAFRRRYAVLSELATLIEVIDETVKKLA